MVVAYPSRDHQVVIGTEAPVPRSDKRPHKNDNRAENREDNRRGVCPESQALGLNGFPTRVLSHGRYLSINQTAGFEQKLPE